MQLPTIKCMALNLNKSVSEELSVCGKLSKKAYATERGHLWKDTQEHSKKRTTLKRLLHFVDSQTNFSRVWLILGNLSDKNETVFVS